MSAYNLPIDSPRRGSLQAYIDYCVEKQIILACAECMPAKGQIYNLVRVGKKLICENPHCGNEYEFASE
jgi:hypothetical protein